MLVSGIVGNAYGSTLPWGAGMCVTMIVSEAVLLFGAGKLVRTARKQWGWAVVVIGLGIIGMLASLAAMWMMGVVAAGFVAMIGAVVWAAGRIENGPRRPAPSEMECPACGQELQFFGRDETRCPVCAKRWGQDGVERREAEMVGEEYERPPKL